jgi:hypothetical protein
MAISLTSVPVGVLQELRHLGLARRRRLDDLVAELAVEHRGSLGAGRRDPADNLRGVADPVVRVAGVDALRGERQREVTPGVQSRPLLEQRTHHLVGRARVGGGLQHHQGARPQCPGAGLGGCPDGGQVRPATRGERRRHADGNGRRGAGRRGIRGDPETPLQHGGDVGGGDVGDVRAAGAQPGQHRGIDVIAGDRQAGPAGLGGQRETHIP